MNFKDLIQNNYFKPLGSVEVDEIGSVEIYPLTIPEAIEIQEVFAKVESMSDVEQVSLITKWAARITSPVMPTSEEMQQFISSVPMHQIQQIFEGGMGILKGQSEAEEKN